MIVVTKNGYKTILSGECMDHLKGFLRAVATMNEIPEIDQGIYLTK